MHSNFRPGTEAVSRADVVFVWLFHAGLAGTFVLALLML
jgi:hypothetical protein